MPHRQLPAPPGCCPGLCQLSRCHALAAGQGHQVTSCCLRPEVMITGLEPWQQKQHPQANITKAPLCLSTWSTSPPSYHPQGIPEAMHSTCPYLHAIAQSTQHQKLLTMHDGNNTASSHSAVDRTSLFLNLRQNRQLSGFIDRHLSQSAEAIIEGQVCVYCRVCWLHGALLCCMFSSLVSCAQPPTGAWRFSRCAPHRGTWCDEILTCQSHSNTCHSMCRQQGRRKPATCSNSSNNDINLDSIITSIGRWQQWQQQWRNAQGKRLCDVR